MKPYSIPPQEDRTGTTGVASTPIPRHFYQCVGRKDALRPEYAANIARIRALNPDYGFTLFDDADILDFLQTEYGTAHVDRFASISRDYGAAKADFFRYLLIYRTGGIYLDIKSTVDRPLDEILGPHDRYILSQWDNTDPTGPYYKWGRFPELARVPHGEYQQWHVIAVPEHPFLAAVIALMLERIRDYAPWRTGYGQMGVMRTTGPVMYTQAIAPIRDRHPHRLVRNETAVGLRYSILPGVHDHRQGGAHYVASFRPIFARTGWRATLDDTYLGARKGFDTLIKQPVRRALGRPA